MRGSSCCAGCCVVFGWGSSGGSSGSSNGESNSGDSVIELSEEGVDVPVDDGVMVAALSRDANLPFCRGCSFQVVLGARLLVCVGDEMVDNAESTPSTRAGSEIMGHCVKTW